jgi:hypothetical protein
MSNKVLWISLDPRTHELTPYLDHTIQNQIEDAYKQSKNTVTLEEYIANKNNVTITFDDKKGHHETTGPMDGQESGGKRSVKRLVFTPNENTQTLHIRRARPDEIGSMGENWNSGESLFATNDDKDKTININLSDILSKYNLSVHYLPDDASAPTVISDPETGGGKKRKSKKSKKSKKRKSKKSKKSKKRKSKKSKKGKH